MLVDPTDNKDKIKEVLCNVGESFWRVKENEQNEILDLFLNFVERGYTNKEYLILGDKSRRIILAFYFHLNPKQKEKVRTNFMRIIDKLNVTAPFREWVSRIDKQKYCKIYCNPEVVEFYRGLDLFPPYCPKSCNSMLPNSS